MTVDQKGGTDRQVDLFREFLDLYQASETKAAIERFCRGLFGAPGPEGRP